MPERFATKLPYDFPKQPEPGEPCIPNEPCALGWEMGEHLARFTQQKALECFTPETLPEMCQECAFRKGAAGNICAATVAAALKCVVEGVPFYCHLGDEPLCNGFRILIAEKS